MFQRIKITVRFEERECDTYRVTCRGRNGGLFQTISNVCEGDFLLDVVLEVGLTNVIESRAVAQSGLKCLFLTRTAV